ncbi:macro domain-containing protein [Alkalimonas sp. MEB108]|uniref:Macro domain-containing protein n=1 Tax=Alkalimonas cellulosilytica TaxID=3058395 RepID=A0ABU7JAM0_9GAMM|nr:macro domain-containing protein [Alkalimonas sp. MEB108]MEE2003037.1 macro domain-containing protein [Alkalimonas sp. MEB108]
MSLDVITGNIFTSNAQTLVNTVNCEGVMGAGIALECRFRYPEMFARYQQLCSDGLLTPGKLWLYKGPERFVLNFPTKNSWKQPSHWSYVTQGLENLASSYRQRGITSIALPLLGADKGGLPADQVLQKMQEHLLPMAAEIPVHIYCYDPCAKDDLYDQLAALFTNHSLQALKQQTSISIKRLEAIKNVLEEGSICQLNQLAKVPGIGIKTLESLFQFSRQQPPQTASLF